MKDIFILKLAPIRRNTWGKTRTTTEQFWEKDIFVEYFLEEEELKAFNILNRKGNFTG